MRPIRDHWDLALRQPDRRPIWEWADGMTMPATLTHREFHVERSRHFMAPLDALQDDHVRQEVIRKPVRGGGTLISDVWHVWCRENEPAPAMAVLQTGDIAKVHAETRLMPMMLQRPLIAAKLPSDRHKIRTDNILFNDGLPFYVNGPSIGNLQTRGIRYMSLDEVWLYDSGTVKEAEGRLKDFVRLQNEKLLLISQGGIEGDDFDNKVNEGELNEWNVVCAGCAKQFPPHWTFERPDGTRAGMKWTEHRAPNGLWEVEKCIESIRYECLNCGFEHTDTTRTKSNWNRLGDYVRVGAPHKTKKAHWWNAVITDPWAVLVSDFLNAVNILRSTGMPDNLIAFFQKSMAEPKSESTANEGEMEFKKVAYDLTAKEDDDFMRVMSVDKQDEGLFYATVRAWKKDASSRRMFRGKLYSHADLKAKADELGCHNVFVDSGNWAKGPNGVYAVCARYDCKEQRWIATKGDEALSYKHSIRLPNGDTRVVDRSYAEPSEGDPESGDYGQRRRTAVLIRFSKDRMKDALDALRRSGKWVEPVMSMEDPEEKDYRKQMSAWRKKERVDKFSNQIKRWTWICPSRQGHYHDCGSIQVLAARIAGVVPEPDELMVGVEKSRQE